MCKIDLFLYSNCTDLRNLHTPEVVASRSEAQFQVVKNLNYII